MKQLEKSFVLRVSECDANGLWRPGAALIEMQEAAGEHSAAMGCGRADMMKRGLVWIVVRMEIHMQRYPSYGERLTLRTFHRPARHRFFPRFFEVRDESGNQVLLASTLWLLMDLETRKSVSADRLPKPLTDNGDLQDPMPWPGAIQRLDAPEKRIFHEAAYTDLDANGHVNNTKYIDWLCNALGLETMSAHPPRTITIQYNSEIRPGQPVELLLKRADLQYQMSGIHDGQTAFEISGSLME